MRNFSNTYIFTFSAIMVIAVALILSVTAMSLKPLQDYNVQVEKMMNILTSVGIESTSEDAKDKYEKYITNTFVISSEGEKIDGIDAFNVNLKKQMIEDEGDRVYPVYVCELGYNKKKYIVPLLGKGLWGPIWGYIALNDDYNSICGVVFDHKAETPGLGAEISTAEFQKQFVNKKIFDNAGNLKSIEVVKGGALETNEHGVDAISGGTITCKGLEGMMKDNLVNYQEYLLKQKSSY